MILHLWLIPLLVVAGIGVLALLYTMKFAGGTGVRTQGRTLVEKPVDDEDDPKSED